MSQPEEIDRLAAYSKPCRVVVFYGGRLREIDGAMVRLRGQRTRMVDPDEKMSEAEFRELAYKLDRLSPMLAEARRDSDVLAINWLETLQQAVRTE